MKPVIQREKTGCGIACAAALAGVRYSEAKRAAKRLGISAADSRLWSDTTDVRRLVRRFGWQAARGERPFCLWKTLPAFALLATKWHREKGKPSWHWVLFVRDQTGASVLDSKPGLRSHRRTDFGRIKPKWYIPLSPSLLKFGSPKRPKTVGTALAD